MNTKIISQFKSQSILVDKPYPVRYCDMVESSHTFGLGGGQWSIELHAGRDQWSECLVEFVGSNGQCFGEEADDLWSEVDNWYSDPNGGLAIHHWMPAVFQTPDGSKLTKGQWLREVKKGRLHGVVLSF